MDKVESSVNNHAPAVVLLFILFSDVVTGGLPALATEDGGTRPITRAELAVVLSQAKNEPEGVTVERLEKLRGLLDAEAKQLAQAALAEAEGEVLSSLAFAMSRCGAQKEAVAGLLPVLETEGLPVVRWGRAARVLLHLRSPGLQGLKEYDRYVALLQCRLSETSNPVELQWLLGHKAWLPWLDPGLTIDLTRLIESQDALVRRLAVGLLSTEADIAQIPAATVERLIQLTQDFDPETVQASSRTLCQMLGVAPLVGSSEVQRAFWANWWQETHGRFSLMDNALERLTDPAREQQDRWLATTQLIVAGQQLPQDDCEALVCRPASMCK